MAGHHCMHPVRLPALLFFLASGLDAQTCPAPAAASEPILFVAANDRGCRDQWNGRVCEFACEYRLTKRSPVKTARLVARWLLQRTAEASWDDAPCSPGVAIYPNAQSSGKTYSRVGAESFDPFDPAANVFHKMAEELLRQVEDRGLPCPPRPTPPPKRDPPPTPPVNRRETHHDHASICRWNFAELNRLRFKSTEINAQLRYLTDARANPTAVSDQLALLDRFVQAIADPNYNGPHKETLDRMRTSASDRASFAAYYGIESDPDAATLIRRARQTTASRLSFQQDSDLIVNRLNIDKQLTEKEIARLRQDVLSRNCGSDSAVSCDISGRWNFFAVGETLREYWTLTPVSAGKYQARNETGSRQGEAEVFVNDVALNEMLLTWRSAGPLPSNFGGSMRVTLRKGCQDGTGERSLSGVDKPVAISAFRDASNLPVYSENKAYEAVFEGRSYQTTYRRESHLDIPIDVFFFKILAPDGSHAIHQGQALWGRFVRQPSVDHPDQSKVTWWAVTWHLADRTWTQTQRTVPAVEIKPQP